MTIYLMTLYNLDAAFYQYICALILSILTGLSFIVFSSAKILVRLILGCLYVPCMALALVGFFLFYLAEHFHTGF